MSLLELGVLGFDVLQQQDDPARFVLVEIYRDAEAAAAHKATEHYPVWRDAVAPMMAEPRRGVKFNRIYPEAKTGERWERRSPTGVNCEHGRNRAGSETGAPKPPDEI